MHPNVTNNSLKLDTRRNQMLLKIFRHNHIDNRLLEPIRIILYGYIGRKVMTHVSFRQRLSLTIVDTFLRCYGRTWVEGGLHTFDYQRSDYT